VAEAINKVIIYHAGGLHEGVTYGRADKLKPSLFQIFAHRVGFHGRGRNIFHAFPSIDDGPMAHKLPDIGVE
jgi:hypothetical protein